MGGALIGVGIGVVVFLVILVLWFIGTYNRFIGMRNQVKNAWSQIDVQLKRRHDLIPNLVEVVKDYMGFEQETLENVTKARNVAMAASGQGPGAQGAAEAGLSKALAGLYVVMENYPDLKANQNVAQLQEELTSTENKIAFSRQFYNDSVMRFNTGIQRIPANIIAGLGGFKAEEFFEIEETEREVPKVDLR